jgi:hypothetical protein
MPTRLRKEIGFSRLNVFHSPQRLKPFQISYIDGMPEGMP